MIISESASLDESAWAVASDRSQAIFIGTDMGLLWLCQPSNALSVLPLTLSPGLVFSIVVDSGSVLQVILELTNELVTV